MIHVAMVKDDNARIAAVVHAYNLRSDDTGPWFVQLHTNESGHVMLGQFRGSELTGQSAADQARECVDQVSAVVARLCGGHVVDRIDT